MQVDFDSEWRVLQEKEKYVVGSKSVLHLFKWPPFCSDAWSEKEISLFGDVMGNVMIYLMTAIIQS